MTVRHWLLVACVVGTVAHIVATHRRWYDVADALAIVTIASSIAVLAMGAGR